MQQARKGFQTPSSSCKKLGSTLKAVVIFQKNRYSAGICSFLNNQKEA